jgi:hypothetical protein
MVSVLFILTVDRIRFAVPGMRSFKTLHRLRRVAYLAS